MSLSGGFHVLHNLLNYNCSWNICQLYLWIYLNVFSQFFEIQRKNKLPPQRFLDF